LVIDELGSWSARFHNDNKVVVVVVVVIVVVVVVFIALFFHINYKKYIFYIKLIS